MFLHVAHSLSAQQQPQGSSATTGRTLIANEKKAGLTSLPGLIKILLQYLAEAIKMLKQKLTRKDKQRVIKVRREKDRVVLVSPAVQLVL